ncbi:putative mitochondrial 2-oxoglutarate/malate carrier protein [Vermiconidia calcicola]|uniref:Mitochondrial 2-oxoglutarate/malate carrier protein n=1 Tax=Vermiconidia calcicola TaxID=1690605 RepID=A0ACC3MUI5_9PEZI|nr:putative mitochondrial 2-oxoglutarate/malate carrier protein [Vermiconidia calcicola]
MSTASGTSQDASLPQDTEAKVSKSGRLGSPVVQKILPFVIGSASGMVATTCIQPVDVVKVRLQLAGEGSKSTLAASPISVARNIVAQGRVTDLWAGLSAGYLRQLSYGMLRLGFFDTFVTSLETNASKNGRSIGFGERAAASLSAGGLAAGIANPAEVALIRMQSDGMKPKEQRANYRSVVDALSRIARNEGLKGLWSGSYPTIIRAMATNFGQLAFFSQSKSLLKKHTNLSFQVQTFTASTIAGFFASFFSLPFDFLKTRLQRGARGASGIPVYNGMMDCALKVLKDEGPLRFYRGFGTYFLRIAPHTVITLFVADNLKALLM